MPSSGLTQVYPRRGEVRLLRVRPQHADAGEPEAAHDARPPRRGGKVRRLRPLPLHGLLWRGHGQAHERQAQGPRRPGRRRRGGGGGGGRRPFGRRRRRSASAGRDDDGGRSVGPRRPGAGRRGGGPSGHFQSAVV